MIQLPAECQECETGNSEAMAQMLPHVGMTSSLLLSVVTLR
jgi:hypothetical protein